MRYKNLELALVGELRELTTFGNEVVTRGSKVIEQLCVGLVIEDPTDMMIVAPARKFSPQYAAAEWLWYLSANRSVENIGKLAAIWRQIQDDKSEVESNYGTYLKPQWQWVIDELMRDNDTRRATIAINQPHHKHGNDKDYPCTQYIQFFLRQGKLHLAVNMRSNDAVYGFCNDVFTFSMFQQMMLNELRTRGLDVELGRYFHHAGSFHVYERHFEMMKFIIQHEPQPTETKFKLRDDITWSVIDEEMLQLPRRELTKEEINEWTKNVMKRIF